MIIPKFFGLFAILAGVALSAYGTYTGEAFVLGSAFGVLVCTGVLHVLADER